MKRFIAFSGGVESSTMCLLFGKGATAIFADTGAEHQKMYERLDYMEQMLKAHHNGDFTLIRLKTHITIKGVLVDNLTDYIKVSKFFPNGQSRFCTRLFKVAVIDKYLREQGECELMVGLNVEESEDRTGNHGLEANVNYCYPLVDVEMDREDCKEALDHYGLLPDFPAYMDRGGCKYCFYKSKKEYKAMVHLALDEVLEVADLEESIQDKRGKYFRIRDNMPAMREFIQHEQMNLLGDLSSYYSSRERKSCGVFCHR